MFFNWEEIIFENFNISENNIINVKLAKVLRYLQMGAPYVLIKGLSFFFGLGESYLC